MAKLTPPEPPKQGSSWLPQIESGTYADGTPLDQLRYLQCKVSLKPDLLTSRSALFKFGELVKRPAKDNGIAFRPGSYANQPHGIREVQFIDTADFRLYNNAFILRRRVRYRDGFPHSDPEIVFKYRHPDAQRAAEMDVRPSIPGPYRIKFKAQALPLGVDEAGDEGGIRMLYSHNVEFKLDGDHAPHDPDEFERIADALPILRSFKSALGESVELVNGTIVEEVDQNVGELDFGDGHRTVVNLALWRTRGEHRPLVGELSFQIKLKRREDINELDLDRGRAFFLQLQREARDLMILGVTKTGIVYHLCGNPPNSHE